MPSRRLTPTTCCLALLAPLASCAESQPPADPQPLTQESPAMPDRTTPAPSRHALDFTVNRIDGQPINLAEAYAGQVVLIVNVASKCGYTPQYAGLQKLHETYGDHPGGGLAVLGFPANEFGSQEPGTNEEIAQFCEETFGVTFDMFEKVVVKGDGIHPLFAHLTSEEAARHSRAGDARHAREGGPRHAREGGHPETAPETGEIKWNFEKFLVGRDGVLVNRFRSKVTPESEEMIGAIEAGLGD